MSRSWERKVRRNSQQLSKQRKKHGLPATGAGVSAGDVYYGRNFIFPITLIALGLIYLLLGIYSKPKESMWVYWLTTGMYVLLGVMIFVRRPYLRVDKNTLVTTKFNRQRFLEAQDIVKISVQSGSVVIEHKNRGGNWVFTRLINRYDIQAMGERLERFAAAHKIPFVNEAKQSS
ncbi:methyltransferase [Paenibacillus sediminis]|uniref:Methyltransferase n=1 Tax=Paenibacillus sediminis TaxID=664909 RepID=A0ABS4H045_9BACL|nr:methyltransferase [Paenibacillus sediminis]MBP1935893.1 hypothetical protein [Paenibacillus sediminis]